MRSDMFARGAVRMVHCDSLVAALLVLAWTFIVPLIYRGDATE